MNTIKLSPTLALPLDVEAVGVRLVERVRRGGPNECWPWLAARDGLGYGLIRLAGTLYRAHRVVFFLQHGWWPPVVMHECDNPPCCNQVHLLAGTKALNNADKMAKGRHRSVSGDEHPMRQRPWRASRGDAHYARKRPHLLARGEHHGMARLSAEDVAALRRAFALGGVSKAELARRFGIGNTHVGRILNGESWK